MRITIADTISDEKFKLIVKESLSFKDVAIKCGYARLTATVCNILKQKINNMNLNIDHFSHSHVGKAQNYNFNDIFKANSNVNRKTVIKYFKPISIYKCASCGLEPIWENKELVLTLNHINGIQNDNRIENLRWLCPNCSSQIPCNRSR